MGFIDTVRSLFGIEKKKESLEAIAKQIADHIIISYTTKMNAENDIEREIKLTKGEEATTQVELRDAETLLRETAAKPELKHHTELLIRNLKEQERFFEEIENILEHHAEKAHDLTRLIHEELLKIRENEYNLEKMQKAA